MKFSSFSIAEMVIDAANVRFAMKYRIVPERLEILKQYCKALDELIVKCGANSFEVEIDNTDMTVHMDLMVCCVECSMQQPELVQLIQRAMTFRVKAEDDGDLRLSFVFPSLWAAI